MNTNPALLKTFDEKALYLLGHIYENGGGEYKIQEYNSIMSRGIVACDHSNVFERLMYSLHSRGWVTYIDDHDNNGGVDYRRVLLTPLGIEEARKTLPQMPMFVLVNQDISTGDPQVDGKINHAKALFFAEPRTMDNMRSACEALSYVLEPLREELTKAITVADVNAFFEIVNKFDIRHNKEHTKNILHPEQLEWVFYSLLNTINTYTKLKPRLILL